MAGSIGLACPCENWEHHLCLIKRRFHQGKAQFDPGDCSEHPLHVWNCTECSKFHLSFLDFHHEHLDHGKDKETVCQQIRAANKLRQRLDKPKNDFDLQELPCISFDPYRLTDHILSHYLAVAPLYTQTWLSSSPFISMANFFIQTSFAVSYRQSDLQSKFTRIAGSPRAAVTFLHHLKAWREEYLASIRAANGHWPHGVHCPLAKLQAVEGTGTLIKRFHSSPHCLACLCQAVEPRRLLRDYMDSGAFHVRGWIHSLRVRELGLSLSSRDTKSLDALTSNSYQGQRAAFQFFAHFFRLNKLSLGNCACLLEDRPAEGKVEEVMREYLQETLQQAKAEPAPGIMGRIVSFLMINDEASDGEEVPPPDSPSMAQLLAAIRADLKQDLLTGCKAYRMDLGKCHCSREGCQNRGKTKTCRLCRAQGLRVRARYCSNDCQKGDWKQHRRLHQFFTGQTGPKLFVPIDLADWSKKPLRPPAIPDSFLVEIPPDCDID